VANGTGSAGAGVELVLPVPSPQLWTPDAPNLYQVTISLLDPGAGGEEARYRYTPVDSVGSYFGMRTSTAVATATMPNITRPALNGVPVIYAGWLDQSFWPDGEFTAPSDDALRFDVQAVRDFGLNSCRLHQKINPQRWYFWADVLGVAVMQDFVQKYGGASDATVDFFIHDAKTAVDALWSHPSVVQWEIFNEDDCWQMFDVVSVHAWLKAYDPWRLIDTQSGPDGRDSMSNRNASDVSDGHSYPQPRLPTVVPGKIHMMGEFGGLGAFVDGHEWANACHTYFHVDTPQEEADQYVAMAGTILGFNKVLTSISIYTQITDVENECDGFYNYDRTNKFNSSQVAEIVAANAALVNMPMP
jgi:hypothetical protein